MDGDNLALTIVGEGVVRGARVVAANPMVGTWRPPALSGFPFLTFLANGNYLHAEYGNTDPNERTEWKRAPTPAEATGAFVSPCTAVDTHL